MSRNLRVSQHVKWNPAGSTAEGHIKEVFTEKVAATAISKVGGIGRNVAKGYQIQSAWLPSLLTILPQHAAAANNEM